MRHVKLENCIFSFFLFLCGAVFHFSRRATSLVTLSLLVGLVFGYAMKNSGLWLAARSEKPKPAAAVTEHVNR